MGGFENYAAMNPLGRGIAGGGTFGPLDGVGGGRDDLWGAAALPRRLGRRSTGESHLVARHVLHGIPQARDFADGPRLKLHISQGGGVGELLRVVSLQLFQCPSCFPLRVPQRSVDVVVVAAAVYRIVVTQEVLHPEHAVAQFCALHLIQVPLRLLRGFPSTCRFLACDAPSAGLIQFGHVHSDHAEGVNWFHERTRGGLDDDDATTEDVGGDGRIRSFEKSRDHDGFRLLQFRERLLQLVVFVAQLTS